MPTTAKVRPGQSKVPGIPLPVSHMADSDSRAASQGAHQQEAG